MLTIKLHLHVATSYTEWILTNQLEKFQDIATELAAFVRKRCDCPFPSSSITSPRFTYQQRPPHVTYRASVEVSMVTREELVSALNEWPGVHRSILIQGEKLIVEMCPVIIQSADDGECEVTTAAVVVARSTLLITVTAVTATFGTVAIILLTTILFACAVRKWRQVEYILKILPCYTGIHVVGISILCHLMMTSKLTCTRASC